MNRFDRQGRNRQAFYARQRRAERNAVIAVIVWLTLIVAFWIAVGYIALHFILKAW